MRTSWILVPLVRLVPLVTLLFLGCPASSTTGGDATSGLDGPPAADATATGDAGRRDAAEAEAGSGDPDSGAADAGGEPTCTVMLSGGPSPGTYDCGGVVGTWRGATGIGSIGIGASGLVILGGVIGFPGQPTIRHYRHDDADVTDGIRLETGGRQWAATARSLGSFDLDVRGLTVVGMDANETNYNFEGTWVGTLEPVPGTGSTGTVALSATFTD
ncbi:MAG: hypothetical protein IT384_09380 [Deltaproteobacteria bacterium]|nr:hypothetical protein [Deltaproteobacteria bacterium]